MNSEVETDKEKLNALLQKEGELGESDRELLLDIRGKLKHQEEKQIQEEEKRKKNKRRDSIFGFLAFLAILAIVIPLVWALMNGWRPYQ